MSGYAVYVYSAWGITYLVLGYCAWKVNKVWHDR